MSEMLKKYEISIWEDELITLDEENSYYKEKKIAVIGSDSMTAQNRVFSPVLKENVNGEKTLTFSLKHRYFDNRTGDFITNPIYPLLVNERKVKLFYNDKWYDFIIKECTEGSEEETFDYVAKDIFVNELSKQGYGIEFNQELNNNLGTIIELGKEAVKDTDWVIDEENCDLLQQTVDEPLYLCTVSQSFEAINVDTGENVTINNGEKIYVFYSYIFNKDGKYLQFLRENDRNSWIYDDNNVIIGTNYRYNGTLIVTDVSINITKNEPIISIDSAYTDNQGYRLVYQPRALYDSVMEQYVELYKANFDDDVEDIYKATSTDYSTSTLVTSFVTNGADFEVNDDKSLVGWDNVVYINEQAVGFNDLSLATYPPINKNNSLVDLSTLDSLSSYVEVNFRRELGIVDGNYRNGIFNRGIMDHGATIGNISKGETYAFRIRVGAAEKGKQPLNLNLSGKSDPQLPVKAYIAFYKTINQTVNGVKHSVKTFNSNDIIFNFNTQFKETPNIITGGTFDTDEKNHYIIDNVVQTPSLKYCYKVEGEEDLYVWNPKIKRYVVIDEYNGFLRYYMNTAKAKQTVTSDKLKDPTVRIGIFLFTNDKTTFANKYLYIEDVEIFKYLLDANNKVILPGNVPTAAAVEKETWYVKPKVGADKDLINTYATKEALADDLYISEDLITQVYNNNCEKILAIEESKSNCFNILQTLCETFECWLKLSVEHEKNGAIKLDENHKPIKKIAFKEYVGKDNYAGFRYGINLNSIERTIDSNEVVTKLIVAETTNEYAENGTLSIAAAKSNPLGQPFIYNLDYYTQKGLIKDKEAYLKDLNKLYQNMAPISAQIRELGNTQAKALIALEKAKAQASVYVETRETAQTTYVNALRDFEDLANVDYNTYLKQHPNDIEEPYLEVVGEIYGAASLLNNIGGVTSATEQEYQKLQLECEGAKEYSIIVSTTEGVQDYEESDNYTSARVKVVIDDYIPGLKFSLKRTIDGVIETEDYETDLNTKEFDVECDVDKKPFDTLVITSLPNNYQLRYISLEDKKIYTTSEGGTFKIYDSEAEEEMTRRFKLVPTEVYAEEHLGYQKQIDKLNEEQKGYIKDFETKYRQYIQEGTWSEDSYINSDLYYFDALQVEKTSAFPQISYSINVAEVSEIEGREGYTFEIGDKTYIEDTEFFGWRPDHIEEVVNGERITAEILTPIKEEVILSEIEWHLDDPSENIITVQNYKTQFEDLFQRISATVQSVEYNEASYTRAASILNQNGEINKDLLLKSLAGIAGGAYPLTASSTIKITDEGVLANNLTIPKNYVKLSGSGISASSDGGHTWKDIVTANGISTDALTAGTINTQIISITDGNNTSFRWDKNGLSAYGFNEYNGYDLTSFVRMDKYGLYGIKNGDEYVVSSLDDLKDKAHFSLTWDGFRIKNTYGNGYVDISSENDFRVVKTNNGEDVTKIHIGAIEKDASGTPTLYGIRINNNDGAPVMETNDEGNLSVTGDINATSGNFTGRVYVGNYNDKYILLDSNYGQDSVIASSDYIENTTAGWAINGSGDAIFNNVSVRGAIKTAVFEYSEIEAVGGAFLFRPSSSIKEARIKEDYKLTEDTEVNYDKTYYELIDGEYVEIGNGDESEDISDMVPVNEGWYEEDFSDIIIVTENNQLFKQEEWVKVSNCNSNDVSLINDGGLTHVYKVKNNPAGEGFVLLEGAAKDFSESIDYGDDHYEEVDTSEASGTPVENGWFEYEEYYEAVVPENDSVPIDEYWYEYDEINEEYILSQDESVDNEKNYYQFISHYILSEDVTIDANKIYYVFISLEQGYLLKELVGGALISFGYYDIAYRPFNVESWVVPVEVHLYEKINDEYVLTTDTEPVEGKIYYKELYENGRHNYGIGINSSDNYVGLPERAISLFESKIHPNSSVKVTYDYKGILGTLPDLGSELVDRRIFTNMDGTQGIFTNNMYIGDENQYVAFYSDKNDLDKDGNPKRKLRIKASQLMFEYYDEETGETDYKDVTEVSEGADGEDAIDVHIESNIGDKIFSTDNSCLLTCHVFKGAKEVPSSSIIEYKWRKFDKNGNEVINTKWPKIAGQTIQITAEDVYVRAIFGCDITF